MPISGCHDLPLATFNLPSGNNLQNKPNSAATMSLPCGRFATAQPQRRWDAPPGKQHRHSGIFRVADLGPGTMPRGKYPESPAPAGSHALISRTPPPGGMLHANLGLPRPPPRNFQPPLRQQPSKQTQQRRHNVPPARSLRDSAAATPVGCAAWRRRFRMFSFRYREMMSGMTMIFLTVMFFPPGILSQAQERRGEGAGVGGCFTRPGAFVRDGEAPPRRLLRAFVVRPRTNCVASSAVVQQQLIYVVKIKTIHEEVKRGVIVFGLGVNYCARIQQELYRRFVACSRRPMQGCVIVVVFRLHVCVFCY